MAEETKVPLRSAPLPACRTSMSPRASRTTIWPSCPPAQAPVRAPRLTAPVTHAPVSMRPASRRDRLTSTPSSTIGDRSPSPIATAWARPRRTRCRASQTRSPWVSVPRDARALTRDGTLVAFHDARLDRVTDHIGAIAELGKADIEAADAGFAFSPDGGRALPCRGRGVRITRLEELLTRWPEARINTDPKSDRRVLPLVALLGRQAAWSRVCIGSFTDRRLRRIRTLSRGRAYTSMGPHAVALARLVATSGRMPASAATASRSPDTERGSAS